MLIQLNQVDSNDKIIGNATVMGVNVLIFGDSVSRYIVDDWCRAKNGSHSAWTTVFRYKRGISPSEVCRHAERRDGIMKKDNLGFVHMYGSPATGPYLHGHVNNEVDPFTDTPLRICKAVDEYTSAIGTPTHVTWAVMWWDLVAASLKPYTISNETLIQNLTTTWGHQVENRLNDIRRCAPRSAIIVATTAHSARRTCTRSRWWWTPAGW